MSISDKHTWRKLARKAVRRAGLLELFRDVRRDSGKKWERLRTRRYLRQLDYKKATDNLTVVLLATDRKPLFEQVQASVESQNLKACQIEIVGDVMPISLACQQGLDRVKTPYFIIVDSDILLRPACFELLYVTIASKPNCGMATAKVEDPKRGIIDGIHIYKTEAVRPIGFHPFLQDASPDLFMKRRLCEEGHLWLHCGNNLVEASRHPEWLPEELYWKHCFLAEAMRGYKNGNSYIPKTGKDKQDWSHKIKHWDKISRWIDEQQNAYVDLRKELTVFVSTVGGTEFSDCLEALKHQNCEFRLEVIENVSPMSAAFQKMIDDCKTPYYIQVDEDMHLFPNGVRELYDRMKEQPSNTAIYAAPLIEEFRNIPVIGVKIYNHRIIKDFPYNPDAFSCEIEQVDRLENAAYQVIRAWDGFETNTDLVLGLLNISWKNSYWKEDNSTGLLDIFSKFYRDAQKLQDKDKQSMTWMLEWFPKYLELYAEKKDPFYLWAFIGSVLGYASSRESGEKTFTDSECKEKFNSLYSLLKDL